MSDADVQHRRYNSAIGIAAIAAAATRVAAMGVSAIGVALLEPFLIVAIKWSHGRRRIP
jgi:hypothetical protein